MLTDRTPTTTASKATAVTAGTHLHKWLPVGAGKGERSTAAPRRVGPRPVTGGQTGCAIRRRRSPQLAFHGWIGALWSFLLYCFAVWRLRARDQRGSQVTDNLGLVVIGIVAIVAIGGLISGLDKTVFNWVTTQLGLGTGTGTGA